MGNGRICYGFGCAFSGDEMKYIEVISWVTSTPMICGVLGFVIGFEWFSKQKYINELAVDGRQIGNADDGGPAMMFGNADEQ